VVAYRSFSSARIVLPGVARREAGLPASVRLAAGSVGSVITDKAINAFGSRRGQISDVVAGMIRRV
jgi:hypothetical protein